VTATDSTFTDKMESFSYLGGSKRDKLVIMIMVDMEHVVNNNQSRHLKASTSDVIAGPLGKVL
jgi:hypothetical protein